MARRNPRSSPTRVLFVSDEKDITDTDRILAFDTQAHFQGLFIGLPVLVAGIGIAAFVVFFTLTNFINVRGIPRIPALGLGVLPALVCVAAGVNMTLGVLKTPDDFRILKAAVVRAE